jgi:hypothetical protein
VLYPLTSKPVTIAVGDAIEVPKVEGPPTQQQLDDLHAKYLAAVTALFEKYKVRMPVVVKSVQWVFEIHAVLDLL